MVLPDDVFLNTIEAPSGWIHIVLNYNGFEEYDFLRIQAYQDGVQTGSYFPVTKYSEPSLQSDGRVVIGRYFTDEDDHYASVQVDELFFFNAALSDFEIMTLSQV